MKKLVMFCCMVLFAVMAKAQLPAISDSAEFYLLTCEPGNISYEKFGHTGIRIVDGDVDITMNWGVFSFEEPNFIGKFVLGMTDYMVDAWSTEMFLVDYRERGSIVYQNKLNLSVRDKRELWSKLQENYKPKNRTYRYNFIYDNCATRAYHMIIESADSAQCDILNTDCWTYRDMVNKYAKPDTWLSLGINIVFGADADVMVKYANSCTFPMEAMELMSYTTNVVDSARVPLLGKTEVLFNEQNQFRKKETNGFLEFLLFIFPVIIMAVMVLMFFRGRRHYWFVPTQIVLWLSGLLGLLILFLVFISSHPLVKHNFNILWCNPFNIVLAIILCTKGNRRVKGYWTLALTICTLLYLVVATLQLQGTTAPLMGCVLLVLGTEIMVLATYAPYLKKKVLEKAEKMRHKRHHHHHHHHSSEHHSSEHHSSDGHHSEEHHHHHSEEHHHHHHHHSED